MDDEDKIISLLEMQQEINCLKHEMAVSFDGWDRLIARFQSVVANAERQERFNSQVAAYFADITAAVNSLDERLTSCQAASGPTYREHQEFVVQQM